jgi:hypothetical protein
VFGLCSVLGLCDVFGPSRMCGRVSLGRFSSVVLRLHMMSMRQVGVMTRLLVIGRFVMLGGGKMVLRGFLMVLGCQTMMFRALFRHGYSRFHGEIQNRSSVRF